MGLKWQNGRDVAKMAIGMQKAFDGVKEDVALELDRSAELGGGLTQDFLEAAHTETGIRRAETRGGFPGRHESGNMIASVSYAQARTSRHRLQSFFGWFANEYEDYFREQDQGGEASANRPQYEDADPEIPAANALPDAFARARESFRARLLGLGLRRR